MQVGCRRVYVPRVLPASRRCRGPGRVCSLAEKILRFHPLISCAGRGGGRRFAQFEREVIGERIRDKFAASRAKGMWMGGNPPLGYEVRERKLVVNPAETDLIRMIFRRFHDLGSALLVSGS